MNISPHRKSVIFRLDEDILYACDVVGYPVLFRISGDNAGFVAPDRDEVDRTIGSMGCDEDHKIVVRHTIIN